MRTYTVERASSPPPLDDGVSGTPWADANELAVDSFNWHDGGPKPLTTARALYDDAALYLQFDVEDANISSRVTELNGPTFEDSSVELFFDPTPDADANYCNFEANCCGVFKLGWQEDGWQEDGWQERGIERDLLSPTLAERIEVRTSEAGPTREPRPDDERWWLAATIPFDVLSEFTGASVVPEGEWRANVYRSGVESDARRATWNPMDTPEPDYHSPEYFGRFAFA